MTDGERNDLLKAMESYLELANKEFSRASIEVAILIDDSDSTRCSVDVFELDRGDGSVCGDIEFAMSIPIEEVPKKVMEAIEYCRKRCEFEEKYPDVYAYRRVGGDNHGMPSHILSFTEFPLYFRFYDGSIELVKDIDSYDIINGEFCVQACDYAPALSLVELHDKHSA